MAGQRQRPGERRRRKAAKKKKSKPSGFVRPLEWAIEELNGVTGWIKKLAGPEGDGYPQAWRAGQLRHYKKRATMLRVEIKAHASRKGV